MESNTDVIQVFIFIITGAATLGGLNVKVTDIIKNLPFLKDGQKRLVSGWVAESTTLLLPIFLAAGAFYLGEFELVKVGGMAIPFTQIIYWFKKTMPAAKINHVETLLSSVETIAKYQPDSLDIALDIERLLNALPKDSQGWHILESARVYLLENSLRKIKAEAGLLAKRDVNE